MHRGNLAEKMTPQSSPECDHRQCQHEDHDLVGSEPRSQRSLNGFHDGLKSVSKQSDTRLDPLNEDFHGKPVRQHVKEFAGLIGLTLLLICAWYLYKRYSLADAGAFFISGWLVVAAGYITPKLFLPVWRGWMGLAAILEVCSTYLILSLIWAGLFIPISGLLKLVGRSNMDLSFRVNCESYWLDRSPAKSDFKLLERQF